MRMRVAAAALAGLSALLVQASPAHAQSSARCGNYHAQVNAAIGRQDRAALQRLVGLPAAEQCAPEAQAARAALARVASPPPPPPPEQRPPSPPPPPPPPPDPNAGEANAWSIASEANTVRAYEAYLRAYPNGRNASAARRRIADIQRPVAPPPPPPPPSFVDARRTPAATRAPLVRNPASLPDFALFRECDGCPEMVVIPGGTFQMGSPAGEAGRGEDEDSQAGAGGSQVRVQVPRFAISRFETTWDEWSACISAGVCQQREDRGYGRGARPIIEVDWNDAGAFAGWVNGRSGGGYRRPTEAEWEYAARAGTTSRWSFGDAESQLGTYAWFASNSGARTQPVGGKAANPFGLYDMHGNVWEWVEDCYRDNLSGQTAAAYTTQGCSLRVLRGGSGLNLPRNLRSAARSGAHPTGRMVDLGFRLARTL